MEVKRTERGWAGHFCCANRCLFRRNTLLEYKAYKVIISTVGSLHSYNNQDKEYEEIAIGRYFETKAFHASWDGRYYDADIERPIDFNSAWAISELDADDKANNMHEAVVDEIIDKLMSGEIE
jgi:hypothetical protein